VPQSYPLTGRTLFITGGGSGIGAETARQASRRGGRVAVVDIDRDAAERVASQLPDAIACPADVRDMASIERAVAAAVEAFGGIDVVMANAGIGTVGTIEGLPIDEVERIVDVNLLGVMRTVKAALPHVLYRRGYVLITASLAAIAHVPPLIHYTATKAGAEAFGNALRIELADRGVDVGVAYFGVIDTAMVAGAYADPVIAAFREQHPVRGPLGKTYPVEGAGRAVVRGIETRARRVMYPRFIRGLHWMRTAMPRLSEKVMARENVGDLVRALNAAETDSPAKAEAALAEQLSPDS
jgi:NAD(P)-dependent dehydrogenase (short-subunit alcohol dehydrogenase family)